ncbi:hypothetical protein PMAYCL1PPCAC_25622, partial [Pristionchus mayeri]
QDEQNLKCSTREDSNAFEKRFDSKKSNAFFFLRCDVDHKGLWMCDTHVTLSILWNHPSKMDRTTKLFSFHAGNKRFRINCNNVNILTNSSTFPQRVWFDIRIIRAEGGKSVVDPNMFAAPNRKSNVILKIGEKKLHVCKEYLAFHSPVFDALFFGNFV